MSETLGKHVCRHCKTYATSRWNTCDICVKHMQHPDGTLVTYVWNICNTQIKHMQHTSETAETFGTIHLQHTCIVMATYATSTWNTCNMHVKHLKHLKHMLATCTFSLAPSVYTKIWKRISEARELPKSCQQGIDCVRIETSWFGCSTRIGFLQIAPAVNDRGYDWCWDETCWTLQKEKC